jgi:hypothetical protein
MKRLVSWWRLKSELAKSIYLTSLIKVKASKNSLSLTGKEQALSFRLRKVLVYLPIFRKTIHTQAICNPH